LLTITAQPAHAETIVAVADLLTRLRTEFAFVGSVARSAWLGDPVLSGPVDVLVTLSPEGRTQIPMMASNRGFRVERDEVEAARELDLVPLWRPCQDEEVRVHALIASNALYGTMVRNAVDAAMGESAVRVLRPEDLAILATLADDEPLRRKLLDATPFDRVSFNDRLRSIGLSGKVVAE
jgi:hypothetical protein